MNKERVAKATLFVCYINGKNKKSQMESDFFICICKVELIGKNDIECFFESQYRAV